MTISLLAIGTWLFATSVNCHIIHMDHHTITVSIFSEIYVLILSWLSINQCQLNQYNNMIYDSMTHDFLLIKLIIQIHDS